MNWRDISTFPGDTPYKTHIIQGEEVRYYEDVLLYGPVRCGWPEGAEAWDFPPEICMGSTHSGASVFYVSWGDNDFGTFCRPTHWMPLSSAPHTGDEG